MKWVESEWEVRKQSLGFVRGVVLGGEQGEGLGVLRRLMQEQTGVRAV